MSNLNSMIALAFIKDNENPFVVFCNYVVYCLSISTHNSLRYDELIESICDIFGLKLSHIMLKTCIRILKKEGRVKTLENGAGYILCDSTFDIIGFEEKRTLLQEKEEMLINDIIKYVKGYNIDWDVAYVKKYYLNFLFIKKMQLVFL